MWIKHTFGYCGEEVDDFYINSSSVNTPKYLRPTPVNKIVQ